MTTSLRDLFATGLPINRKERYYTGTVLPALLCANSMRHLHRLTDYLGLGRLHVHPDPSSCTVEFFTEYSPVESAVGKAKSDFAGLEGTTKDTPDVVILVTEPVPTLIALEAKMFDRPSLKAMQQQLDAQKAQLEVLAIDLAKRLSSPRVDVVHHALLPQALAKAYENAEGLTVPVVEWEWVRDNYADVDQDYFHAVLDHALSHYDQLKSSFSGNQHGEVRGDRLVKFLLAGDTTWPFMGIMGALTGPELHQVIADGSWASRDFMARHDPIKSARWFPVAEFVRKLTEAGVDLSHLDPALPDVDLDVPQ